MIPFILIALLITIIVAGLLIWPLRKNRHSVSYARQAQNIHYAKERIEELEQQLNNASISATDYEALKSEIESTLADDIDMANLQTEDKPTHSQKSNALMILLLCTLLPLSATAIYLLTGTPESLVSEPLKTANSPAPALPQTQQEIDNLLESVKERLKDHPNDVHGWRVLSRSYLSLGRFDEAKAGLKKLIELEGETPETLVNLADATAAGGSMAGEAHTYIKRALELAPQYPQALWMAGISAMQSGDTNNAIAYWEQLIPLLDQAPQQQKEIRDLITQTKQQAHSESESTTPSPKGHSNGVSVFVSLAPSLLDKVSPSDAVFVFAKATQGPPAPLAVKRLTVAQLPATIILNDSDAMIEQLKLSLFNNITISARVAKSGDPIAQTGDLESSAVDITNDTKETINIVISSIRQ